METKLAGEATVVYVVSGADPGGLEPHILATDVGFLILGPKLDPPPPGSLSLF